MRKLCKRLILLGLAVIVLLGNCLPVFAAEDNTATQGEPVCCEGLTMLDNGNYYCILLDAVEEAAVFSYPERQVTTTFTHDIVDRNGEFIAMMTTTVTGEYSEVEHTAVISSITAYYSNAQVSGLSYSVSYSGDTATIDILLNGLSIGSSTYKLTTNGSIVWIA